ncbi:MAG: FTR1 family iron permease [Cyanothece sp. SIO1E1]|nr:FTR1 family iron permease [Cyanothece sp. SIO1E1]
MDFTAALPTFVITLREGVEAALVVGIVLACMQKANQSQLNAWVYLGIGAGIGGSALTGLLLNWGLQQATQANTQFAPVIKPLLESGLCMVAIAMLSWMLIWMTQQARSLKADITGSLHTALGQNAVTARWSIFSLILIAVLREGFEAVVFIFANFQQGGVASLGAIAGLAGAVGIGLALFKWGVQINIRLFFQVMGLLLLLIVAGLVVSACKHIDATFYVLGHLDTDSLTLCFSQQSCILGPLVWDASQLLPDQQFPGVVLKALFGYRDHLYLLQTIGYSLFLITVGSLYFRSLNTQAVKPSSPAIKGN